MSEREPNQFAHKEPPEIERFFETSGEDSRNLPRLEEMSPEFIRILEELEVISGFWNPVEIYTADPESIRVEKEKVYEAYKRGEQYNPAFTYGHAKEWDVGQARESLLQLQSRARAIEPTSLDERLARVALDRKIQDDLATTLIVEGIQKGDDAITAKGFQKKYQGIDDTLVALAQAQYEKLCQTEETPTHEGLLSLEEYEWLKNTEFNAEEIKEAFEFALRQYGILRGEDAAGLGFKVVVDKRAVRIDVRDKSIEGSTIFIPEDSKKKGTELLALINHEIGAHARQSMNGKALFHIGGGMLRFDDETLYEGLALRNDKETKQTLFGIHDATPEPKYTLAIRMAEKGKSFAEIFSGQVEYYLHVKLKIMPDQPIDKAAVSDAVLDEAMKKAWLTSYRVMRGHSDTSNKEAFAMAKDLSYLRGFQIDQALQKRGAEHVNESAVIARGGLAMLAHYKLSPEDLPIQYEVEDPELGKVSPAHAYFYNVLKTKMNQ